MTVATRAPAEAAAVEAARSPMWTAFLTWIMRRHMARGFHAVRAARPDLAHDPAGLPADRPLIVYSNHPAWWDPAFFLVLSNALFAGRASFGPMDAAALARYRILRRVGIFGVEQDSFRGAARFLRVAEGLLARPDTMLWITAQGAFTDVRDRPVKLQPGLARLLARCPRAVAVPLALEYPFWSEKQPEALCRFGAPIATDDAANAAEDIVARQTRLEAALTRTMDALSESARARDPVDFTTLISGRAGVGGVYDLGRRLRAAATGRRFDGAHAPDRGGRPRC